MVTFLLIYFTKDKTDPILHFTCMYTIILDLMLIALILLLTGIIHKPTTL